MTRYARQERDALCDLLTSLGPDQPTLCEGWLTRDLAAHLVLRERRPDAAPGIVLPWLAGHTARVQRALAARPYPALVATLRRPPALLTPFDEAMNALEFFVHHEDVRRARPDWQPRPLPDGQARGLWRRVRAMSRLALRRFPATVVVTSPGFGEFRAGAARRRIVAAGEPAAAADQAGTSGAPGGVGPEEVRVSGSPGELAMFFTGRQRAARVALTGPAEAAGRLAKARLGV